MLRQRVHQPDPTRAPGHPLDRTGGFQRFEVVLRAAHARNPNALAISACEGGMPSDGDAFADQGEDGLLGIGQVHG